MRILIVSGIFHPETGGPATYLFYLLPALQAHGHEIRVITFGEPDATPYGYPVTRITRRQSIPRRLIHFTYEVLHQAKWADLLFVQGYPFPVIPAHLVWRRPMVTKVVSDFSWEFARRHHWTELDVIAFQSARHPRKLRLLRALYFRTLRIANAIIVPSEHIAQLVRQWNVPETHICLIENAIPPSDLAQVDRQALRQELGLTPNRFLAVTVGRLTPVKGVDVAIRAMRDLPDAELVIVGSGEQQPELEVLAAHMGARVRFVGQQPHDLSLRYIRAADVFVLSSHTEGLSHVLLEALQVGTPAIATAVGGNTEILENGIHGLLVPPNDPLALAAALNQIKTDPVLAAQLAENGKRRSVDFGWDTLVRRTETLLCAAATKKQK